MVESLGASACPEAAVSVDVAELLRRILQL